jgi:AcrR family transcriptional regulator
MPNKEKLSLNNSKVKRPYLHLRSRITKRIIVKTATELFLTQGFDKTKIRNICDTAKVCSCTVYNHYKNKDAVLCGIIDELLNPYYLILEEVPEPKNLKQAKEYFKELTLSLLNIADQNKDVMELYFSVFPKSEFVAEHWITNLNAITDNIFKNVLTSSKVKINKGLDVKMVAKSYVYLLDRFIVGIVKGNEDNFESIANTIESILFDGAVRTVK